MIRALSVAFLLTGFGGPASAPPAEAPRPSASGHPLALLQHVPKDSLAALERAREAQAAFERLRFRFLPRTLGTGWSECDDQVGRMCWRHDPGGGGSADPEDRRNTEDPRITDAREGLLDALAEVAREIPGDGWVLGQRVWYLGEAGRWDEGAELAARCRAPERWWCAALEGLALHEQGLYGRSHRVFEVALDAFPPERREAWLDPEPLLDGEGVQALRQARDEGNGNAFVARVWNLSDPLYLAEGNDRLTAHLARRTVAMIRSDARNPYRLAWGDDLEELLVRYGWAVEWERQARSSLSLFQVQGDHVVGREKRSSRSFIPPGVVLADPSAHPAGSWVPGSSYAPSAYAPAYAPSFLPAPGTVTLVELGDSVAVVAAIVLPTDTTRHGPDESVGSGAVGDAGQVDAGLFVRTLDGDGVAQAVASESGGTRGDTARFLVTVPPGPYLVSVEILDRSAGLAGRRRVAVVGDSAVADVPRLSDLLILADGPEPQTLLDALPTVLPEPRLRAGDTIRVLWSVVGLGFREEVLSYRIGVEPRDRGVLRRIGERLGLVDASGGRRIEWAESSETGTGPRLRSVTMVLGDLEPGSWAVRLELRTPGRSVVVRERRIEVGPPRDGGSGP